MIFSTMFRSIKMAVSGEVIQRIDTPIMDGHCTISLRLKRDRKGRKYVVLAGIASGNYQYYPMELEQFRQIIEAALAIQSATAAE
ncbi:MULTISPECIES: hypothetical protein [unclassified Mesorhizobium]|uniref:hypothetical protein n=1 Tax=unclassified Mesorhizobium TaxID=325217 RepID=UPI0007FE9EE5|nr:MULTISPECIES: hypothetical protein [unclassified Mesorhizobium]OBQ80713.1 hypothetical protein A9K71_28625 [Mesorhizobium sp. WSM3873]PBB89057.1 hypothetical protein CK215_29780 [Mesorhizobium sp. WSM3864]